MTLVGVFFGIVIFIAKLAGVGVFDSGSLSSSRTIGLLALRFDDDLGEFRLGVGVVLNFGDRFVGTLAGVDTFLTDAFLGVDFGSSSGSLGTHTTESLERSSSSKTITSFEVRTFSFASSILFTFDGRLLSASPAESLRFRLDSMVEVEEAAGDDVDDDVGANGAFVDGVTVLKGKRAWTSFRPTGETLEGLFFIFGVAGIAGKR